MSGHADYGVVGQPFSPTFLAFMNITNTLTQLALGGVALCGLYFANIFSGSTHFKQHIYLCVTGYIILMSQAILCMNPHTGWAQSFKYRERKAVHWVIQIIGSILAITGSVIRITNINNHLETPHGILGVIALLLTFLSLIGGVVNLYSMKLKINPNVIKVLHALLGSATIIAPFLALIFAFDKTIYRIWSGNNNANLSIGLTSFALFGILLSPCLGIYRRIAGRR